MRPSKNKLKFTDTSEPYFHLEAIHENNIDISGREMWIHSVKSVDPVESGGEEPGVEYTMATQTIKNLHFFRRQDPTLPVTIHLHTCGGIVEEGLAIYDNIRAMPYFVRMVVHTHARSMSSYILQSANERLMLENSTFMFHRGDLAMAGETQTVYSNIEWCKNLDIRLMKIYVDALKKKGKFKTKSRLWIGKMINDLMGQRGDVFLTAIEAIEWGFADKILKSF